jgi:oxalate decarboxylase/phosphoglucose isomerase-like protein (cupin superfamily)
MSRANSKALVAALLCALYAAPAGADLPPGVATGTESSDTLVTPFAPTLTPWAAGCSVYESSSSAGSSGMSSAQITLGPCASRQLHWHTNADEWVSMTAPTGALGWRPRSGRAARPARADPRSRPRARAGLVVSVLIAPNNTMTRTVLAPGDAALYPRGWAHMQSNPSCDKSVSYVLVWNAASSGTVDLVLTLAAAPPAYLASAFASPPVAEGLWVVDAECQKLCKG